jgi:D-3-phosphoglycerate dehydrogenase / 2-oxoglutarate reductase
MHHRAGDIVTTSTVAVLGTRYPDLSVEQEVLAPLGVELVRADGGDAAGIVAAAGQADVVLAGSGPRFTREVISQLSCRGIVRYGIGVDSVDLAAAREHGLWVARVSDYGTEAVAVHAVTMGLAGARRLPMASQHVLQGGWGFAELRPLHLPTASTAGVVGYGRIGRYAAALLRGFGYRVLVHDPFVTATDDDVTLVADLEDLLAAADLVTLHVPGAADGSPLLGADELAACKPGSVLVNTARGSLIDRAALLDALAQGRPGIAALDVFDTEPLPAGAFDAVRDRVILSPHMAWYSEESELDLRIKASQEAARLLRGERPLDVVIDPTEADA